MATLTVKMMRIWSKGGHRDIGSANGPNLIIVGKSQKKGVEYPNVPDVWWFIVICFLWKGSMFRGSACSIRRRWAISMLVSTIEVSHGSQTLYHVQHGSASSFLTGFQPFERLGQLSALRYILTELHKFTKLKSSEISSFWARWLPKNLFTITSDLPTLEPWRSRRETATWSDSCWGLRRRSTMLELPRNLLHS